MGDFWGGRPQRGLSQLKHSWHFRPLFARKAFSSFTILFLGAFGTFPALPVVTAPDEKATSSPESEQTVVSVNPLELCRWQRDFTFFSDLVGDKTLSDEEEPCTEPIVKTAAVVPSEVPGDQALSDLIVTLTSGYPLEVMAPTIAEYDREVAALIVGIAKKESNWGKRVPVDAAGKDCFNYWGFKGAGARGVAMGHGCFGSPEEAVRAVGNRIAQLVELRKTSEPKNMIIWKCGSSCATHSPESVRKWIADVDMYYQKIVKN